MVGTTSKISDAWCRTTTESEQEVEGGTVIRSEFDSVIERREYVFEPVQSTASSVAFPLMQRLKLPIETETSLRFKESYLSEEPFSTSFNKSAGSSSSL
jgi:hypothetical protein